MQRLSVSLCVGLLILLITACSGGEPGEPVPETDYFAEASEEVRTLYEASCIYCHASDLRGHVGDASNLQTIGARLSQAEIKATIADGRGMQMPAFESKLSAEEIEQLANWLSTLK